MLFPPAPNLYPSPFTSPPAAVPAACACPVCGAAMAASRIIVDPRRRWLAFRGFLLELGRSEAALAAAMVERSTTLDELAAVLADGGRAMDQQGVKNVLQRLKRKLELVGLAVESVGYGQGWRVTAGGG